MCCQVIVSARLYSGGGSVKRVKMLKWTSEADSSNATRQLGDGWWTLIDVSQSSLTLKTVLPWWGAERSKKVEQCCMLSGLKSVGFTDKCMLVIGLKYCPFLYWSIILLPSSIQLAIHLSIYPYIYIANYLTRTKPTENERSGRGKRSKHSKCKHIQIMLVNALHKNLMCVVLGTYSYFYSYLTLKSVRN